MESKTKLDGKGSKSNTSASCKPSKAQASTRARGLMAAQSHVSERSTPLTSYITLILYTVTKESSY